MDWKDFQPVCSFGIYSVCHEHLLLTVTMTGTHLWKQALENVFVQPLREFDISYEHNGPNPRCDGGMSLCFKFSHPLTNVNICLYLGDKGIDFFFFPHLQLFTAVQWHLKSSIMGDLSTQWHRGTSLNQEDTSVRQSAGFIFTPTQRFDHKGQDWDINSILTRDKGPCGSHFECHGGEQEDNVYMVFDFRPRSFSGGIDRVFIFMCLGKLIRGTKEVSSTSIPFILESFLFFLYLKHNPGTLLHSTAFSSWKKTEQFIFYVSAG